MKQDVEGLDDLPGGEHSADFVNPLPGDEEAWTNCTLGPPSHWPETLQAFVHMITSFAYPAAVFWGEDLLLLHNEAWAKAGGSREQAQKQRGRLTAEAWNALEAPLLGGKPRAIEGCELLREDATSKEAYTVLVSPLFDEHERDSVVGLLAQLMPRCDRAKTGSEIQPQNCGDSELDALDHHKVDVGELCNAVDNISLDQHPFFHRFAEMLPSGLAILDHKAQAVFVNQHFYELTTHTRKDKSFSSWPQSIHADDYDRVMGAYQEAFSSHKQLRTEFRTQGASRPWRLLLLTPIGDENLEHVSVRDYGGFVCSIVDISCEKSVELAQRKAAEEATERREQQERFIDMVREQYLADYM
jgi:PAS domain-containing protein